MVTWVAGAALAQTLAWEPCDLTVIPEASCASLSVPLDATNPNLGTTTLALAKIDAIVQPARGQLWFVTGGPGDSGIDELSSILGMQALVPDLDIVTFDHRGTGRSGRLSCPSAEDPTSQDGIAITRDEWPECMDYVASTYGEELNWLTVSASAVDLVLMTDAVVGEDQEVYWWGVSYGSYLVQRALHLVPDAPDGVILDGLVPVDWTFTEFDAGLDTTARRWLGACDEDPSCASHFSQPVGDLAEQTLIDIPKPCERLGLDLPTARLLTGVLMMPGEPYASLAPAIWARLSRCASRDRRAFVHLFEALFPEDGSGLAEKPGHSPVLQRHIAYADLWESDADPSALRDALDDTISTTEVSANFAEIASDWPIIPPPARLDGEILNGVWPEPSVPILALHGGFDPTMPVERIDAYASWLDEENQQLIIVPFAEHVTLNKGDCPASLYEQFLKNPRSDVDASCVAQMQAYDWEGEDDFNEEIFGVPDRFGDRACGCHSGRSPFAWPPAMLLVLSLFWRRR